MITFGDRLAASLKIMEAFLFPIATMAIDETAA
jgi:hypothetical protein